MTGPIELSLLDMGLAALLVLINAALSLWLGLGLERRLLVASLRTVVQLLVLGTILVPVFQLQSAPLVVAVVALMLVLAGREAVSRTERRFSGMYASAFVSMALGALVSAGVGTALIIGVEPWWEPRYVVPIVGMILGNALTGVSLGLDRCMAQLDEGALAVETRLAFGATPWEAVRSVVAESLRTGMVPILNAMSAVGLVTIPGMMTGQILGGTPPEQAARYQILIMFLIAAATALGTAVSVLLCARAMFDGEGRLRRERLTRVAR